MATVAEEPWVLDIESGLYKLPGSGFGVPKKVFEKLFPYQRNCVRWMFTLSPHAPPHLAPKPPVVSHGALAALRSGTENPKLHGGILADDMGLGKTAQTVSFIAALFHSDLANAVLVACPVSVMPVWEAEFKAWAPEIRVRTYHGTSKAERVKAMRAVQTRGGVLITSYGMLTSDPRSFGGEEVKEDGGAGKEAGHAVSTTLDGWLGGGTGSGTPERGGGPSRSGVGAAAKRSSRKPAATPAAQLADLEIRFDLVVCDEGHKLKNAATQVARALRTVPSDMRLLLTGTPVQNNLEELWALMDYVTWGGLLGSRRTFNREIADYVVAGRDRLATAADKRNAADAGQLLSSLVAPYILRREKAIVFAPGGSGAGGGSAGAAGDAAAAAGAAGVAAGSAEGASDGVRAPAGAAAGAPLALLAEKKEVVLWTRMAPLQLHLYAAFLQSEEVKDAMACAKTPLAAITLLRKLACHPLMVKQVAEGQIDIAIGPDAAEPAEPEGTGGGEGETEEGGAETGAVPKGPKGGRAGAVASDRTNAALAAQQLAALRAAALDAPAGFDSLARGEQGEEAVQGFEPPSYHATGASAGVRAGAMATAASPPAGLNLQRIPVPLLLASSGKLQALVALMRGFRAAGNKVLIFSESLKLLDMVEAVLSAFPLQDAQTTAASVSPSTYGGPDGAPDDGQDASADASADGSGRGSGRACTEGRAGPAPVRIHYVRIDGSVTDAAERRALVARFNADERVRVCLLTTGVGALGLTLNSADRVVVISPSWNPAVESQAVRVVAERRRGIACRGGWRGPRWLACSPAILACGTVLMCATPCPHHIPLSPLSVLPSAGGPRLPHRTNAQRGDVPPDHRGDGGGEDVQTAGVQRRPHAERHGRHDQVGCVGCEAQPFRPAVGEGGALWLPSVQIWFRGAAVLPQYHVTAASLRLRAGA
jgi:SNF2 family DNA or RNA helicase